MHIQSFSRRQEDESGAAALILLTAAMVIALAIFATMVVPLTLASDQKSRNRVAADAAALAGAEAALDDLGQVLIDRGWLGGWGTIGTLVDSGQSAAADYASRNGGTLTAYRADFTGTRWRVSVTVRSAPVEGSNPISTAEAEIALPDCRYETQPTPEPSTDPDEDEDEEESEPTTAPPPSYTFSCAGITLSVDPSGDPDDPQYGLPSSGVAQLLDPVEARLVN